MKWIELQEFITTLTEEQLNDNVIVIDSNTDSMLELDNTEIAEESMIATFSEGIYSKSDLDGLEQDEIDELLNDVYLQIEEEQPYLVLV